MFSVCNDCTDFDKEPSFQSRENMIPYIHLISKGTQENKLEILAPDEEYQNNENDLIEIKNEPPYPDIIFYKLLCKSCGKKYRIFIDWYHVKGQCQRI